MNKDFLLDGLTNIQIIDIVQNIRISIDKYGSTENNINSLKIKYSFFEERYTSLFEMVTNDLYNDKDFHYMMNMRNKIINDQKTNEQASAEIGHKFHDKYQK
jgi:hypothetical protein